MNYQFSVNVRSNEHLAKSREHDIRDDSDSAEDDHSFYPSRPPTVSYYGLPYLDHTYGAPWPPSPPPSVVAPPMLAVPRVNGHIDIDNVSYHAEVCTTAVDIDPDNQYADSITRCICGFLHDDGYMICCDKCGVWQHVDCMGVEREHIPEVYLCEVCQPRYVDRRKAMLIQRKRYELMTGAVDVEAVDVGDDGSQLPLARDLNNMVPLSPLPSHPHASHPGPRPQQSHVKMLQRSVQLSAGHKPVYRPKFHRGSRKIVNGTVARRSNGKYSTDEDFDDDEGYVHYRGRNGTVENRSRDVDVAEMPNHVNTYSSEVVALLRAHRHLNGQQQQQLLTWQSISEKLLPLSRHLCRAVAVTANSKGLQVLEDVETSRPLIEYTGNVKIDEDDCEVSSKRLQPFVLVYAKFESARLRIESGATDSDAKFVRRSCKPNAEIRHLSDNSAVRLFVFSSRPIFRGQEITIPYDMDYSESETFVCACGRDPCPLLKSTRRFSRTGRRKKSERESVELSVDVSEEDEDAKLTGTTAGGRRKRQDSGHDLHPPPRSPPPATTNGSGGTIASRRRTSDEEPAVRHDAQPNGNASTNRRRKKSLGSSDDDATTAAVKVEDSVKRSAKRNVERSISVSDKSKPAVEKEDKKPKVTLEHSVSCSSPVKDGADSCFGDRRMSREERKLEAIMKAFERLEQQQTVKRRDSVSKSDGKMPGKVEVKEEIKEEFNKRPSAAVSRLKKKFDSRKPGAKKINGRRRPWLTLKRSTSKNSNVSTNSTRKSPVGGRVTSVTAPCTPLVDTSTTGQLAGMPFKFPKTKKAMMSEWIQERTSRGEQQRSLGSGDNEKSVLDVGDVGDDDENEDMDKYVNYIQTPSRHVDVLKNVRRTSSSSGSSKGSPASLYHLQQQQAEFGAGSAKKRWLRQVMHETGDGDGVGNVPPSPGAVSLATPHQSPAVERQTPLKKRRFTRESTGDEAETLLSLANSVPAMEYEQLEKSKAAEESAAVNLNPSLDASDNLFERFSAHRRLNLAEQLLALSGCGEMEDSTCEVPEVAMAAAGDVAGGDTKPDDGMLLLLAGIEQAAARERANSLQPTDIVQLSATCDTASLNNDIEVHHQQHCVTFADDAVGFADNNSSSLPLSFDSNAIGLLAELSETVLQQHSVASVITDRQQPHVVGCSMLTAETVDSCRSNDNASASSNWTSLTTFTTHRTSFCADDASYTAAHSSADGSALKVNDALLDMDSNSVDSAAGLNSAHERRKVSLADYRSRMRERSSSLQSKVPMSPTPGDSLAANSNDDAVSLADETFAGASDCSNVRHDGSVEWSVEATAVEKLREHSNYQHWLHVDHPLNDQSAARGDGEQLVDRRMDDRSAELLHADV